MQQIRRQERMVAQWLRHLEKLRRVCREIATRKRPALQFVMRADDTAAFLTVPDGDGFMFAGLRVRLHGIDAPEHDQTCFAQDGREWPCGEKATRRLRSLLKGREVCIEVLDVDCYGRLVAICRADGEDVGRRMVREGWALALDREMYGTEEERAARKRRGIWGSAFEDPASYRRSNRPSHRKSTAKSTRKAPRPQQGMHVSQKQARQTASWEELRKALRGLRERLMA